jgi:hypothetical protein
MKLWTGMGLTTLLALSACSHVEKASETIKSLTHGVESVTNGVDQISNTFQNAPSAEEAQPAAEEAQPSAEEQPAMEERAAEPSLSDLLKVLTKPAASPQE